VTTPRMPSEPSEPVSSPARAGRATPARWRTVAFPVEHGGWGFLTEPILLGLLAAGSAAGLWLAVAGPGLFLFRQPFRIALKDWLRRKRYARTALAERFAAAFGIGAATAFALAILTRQGDFWLPLALAVLLALVQLRYDTLGQARKLLPEVAGALALNGLAPAMAMAGGWSSERALLLWLILGARTVTSILYVRVRLRRIRGEAARPDAAIVTHLLALALLAALALADRIPPLAALAVLPLLGRAVYGFSPARAPVRARTIGFQEMGYGVLYAILVALGYRLAA
jgi:hypothetical protein